MDIIPTTQQSKKAKSNRQRYTVAGQQSNKTLQKKQYTHRWARYFKKVAERALNAKKIF